MRVLQVSNFYPPYWVGGYEQIAGWVASGLRERGHTVDVLTGRGPAFDGRSEILPSLDLDLAALWEDYFSAGIAAGNGVFEAIRRHVFSGRNFAACRRALRRLRPDIVSFWNPACISFSPLLAARLEGVPAVVHLSDTVANVFRNPHPPVFPARLRRLGRLGVDVLLRAARPHRFVVPSDFLRRKFVKTEGLPAARVEVLHWPIEPTLSQRTAHATAHGSATRILFVGTLIPEKGVHVLIDAFRDAQARSGELTLTLVGDGPRDYVTRLKKAAQGLPARFLGRCERAAVTQAYESHDILTFPSTWDEPYAVVPLEAMAMGLAVIATNVGGTPEALEDGRTGLLVPPADAKALCDAILRLVTEPDLCRSLAAAGERRARERQSFPIFMQQLERLYASLAA